MNRVGAVRSRRLGNIYYLTNKKTLLAPLTPIQSKDSEIQVVVVLALLVHARIHLCGPKASLRCADSLR